MFGISSGELFFIAIIALIVLGPERLPKVTRLAGMWVRRARNQWNSVKDELERELAAEELKRSLHDAQTALQETERKIRENSDEARREFEQVRASVQRQGDAPEESAPAADDAAPAPAPSLKHEGESDEPRSA
ncbi:MAG: Sec-independent protein translocase protein TatB [Pseudoxanthomonas sp.]